MAITLDQAVDALLRIRETAGPVCENFTECNHRSCHASCGAWMIADEALFGGIVKDFALFPDEDEA